MNSRTIRLSQEQLPQPKHSNMAPEEPESIRLVDPNREELEVGDLDDYCRMVMATCLITHLDHDHLAGMNDSSVAGVIRETARRSVKEKLASDERFRDRLEHVVEMIQRDWLRRYQRFDGLDRRTLRVEV